MFKMKKRAYKNVHFSLLVRARVLYCYYIFMLFIRACMRTSRMSFSQYLWYASMDFLQTFVGSASCNKDELVRFWGQKVKLHGHSVTRYAINVVFGVCFHDIMYLSLVHRGTKMDWLTFGFKRSKVVRQTHSEFDAKVLIVLKQKICLICVVIIMHWQQIFFVMLYMLCAFSYLNQYFLKFFCLWNLETCDPIWCSNNAVLSGKTYKMQFFC